LIHDDPTTFYCPNPILLHLVTEPGEDYARSRLLLALALSRASTDAAASYTESNATATRSARRSKEASEIDIDTGSLGLGEKFVQRLDLFESMCCQLALARKANGVS
jgi:hypothetical protein